MIIVDEKILRTPCSEAEPSEVGQIIEALERELERSAELGRPGIGLAAPQIGIFKKVAIVRIPTFNSGLITINLVNAKVTQGFDKTIFDNEGCLSFPDRYEKTSRFQEVYVAKNMVEPYSFIVQGLVAQCVQHELDHTEGVLLPDVALPGPKKKK